MNRSMSGNGLELLTLWEGFEEFVYGDAAGLPTIGVGHLLTQSERSSGKILIDGEYVRYREGLSEEQVRKLLAQDLKGFETVVNEDVVVRLAQHQFDALVSFAFNVGKRAFRKSTLLRKLNQGQYSEVPEQLRRWTRAGGKELRGLINRRENEIKRWNGDLK